MDFVEDSYEKALRIYGSQVEKEVITIKTQVIGKHIVRTYKIQKKSKKKVVYKL